METASLLLNVLTISSVLHVISGHSRGEPPYDDVCRQMFPKGHNVDAQDRAAPYVIRVSSTVYSRDQELIIVSLHAQDGYFIRGLLLQARRSDCLHPLQQEPVGIFDLSSADNTTRRDFKTLTCLGREDSAVTHTNETQRAAVKKTEFRFITPARDVGNFYFVATIVKQQDIFWTGVTSDEIRRHTNDVTDTKCPMQSRLDKNRVNTTPNPHNTPFPWAMSPIPATKSPIKSGCTSPIASVALLLPTTLYHILLFVAS
ncbi:hypothetical protein DPMN_160602 [Dreissena polymorpha]|uniref:Reelin domain-containing protein n=1 Tax=Dreissena polymorpha TaxID=45954 RepID=A0A9D4ENT1_DREPO|nr:hypothetical protein DPMN_160602 [Dreissena polymorpha]